MRALHARRVHDRAWRREAALGDPDLVRWSGPALGAPTRLASFPSVARSRLRLCFANPEPETIRKGVEVLADVCRREFGVPLRSANVEKK